MQMSFVKFLVFKYKLNSQVVKKRSSAEVYAQRSVFLFIGIIFTLILCLVFKAFPKTVLDNMKVYTVIFYALMTIVSISASIKKYYKEYFESKEREILLITPVKKTQIIIARFFVVALEVSILMALFYVPFILASYFNKIINIQIILITIPQILCMSFCASAFAHIIFSCAFLLCRGKGLKKTAYFLVIILSALTTAVIIFSSSYKNLVLTQNTLMKYVLYTIFQYPIYILSNSINALSFTFIILIYTIFLSFISFILTSYSYKKGLLSISSRELQNSFYVATISKFISKYIKNEFLKKDILFLSRNPNVFSIYISPIILICLIESKSSFFQEGFILPIFISILGIAITSITLSVIQLDDAQHKDLLLIVPLNNQKLFESRSKLNFFISVCISYLLVIIICLIRSTRLEYLIFSLVELAITIYISSRIMTARVIKKSIKKNGYSYNGSVTAIIAYYVFTWSLPIIILFSILFNNIESMLNNKQSLVVSFGAVIFLLVLIVNSAILNTTKNQRS